MKLLILLVGGAPLGFAPNLNPVRWSVFASSPTMLRLLADVDSGYHLYSLTTPKGGPIRTKIGVLEGTLVTLDATLGEVKVETFSPKFLRSLSAIPLI